MFYVLQSSFQHPFLKKDAFKKGNVINEKHQYTADKNRKKRIL